VKRLATPGICAALFLVGVLFNWPMFQPGEFPFRGSIEGGYAGMARFVSAHPNPWGWNPLPYCGLPTQFLYLPALPYATALASMVAPNVAPEYLYRLITAIAACLAPVALFLFALRFTGSRKWAAAAALAFALMSPAYGLFPHVEKDRGIAYLPWHIQVLAKYGEGPHNLGLALMPLVLLALWSAARGKRFGQIALAAVLLAAVALSNWVSSLALAIAALLFLLAGIGERDFRPVRVIASAGLGYLLACFWLTPTFIKTIAFNWPTDAFGFRFGGTQLMLLAGLAAAVAAVRFAFHWLRGSFYFCYVTLCALVFGWLATAYYVFGIDTIPESRRYALEFELFLILALAEACRMALRFDNSTVRLSVYFAGGLMLLMGVPQLASYATQGWTVWAPVPRETTLEYRIGKWLSDRKPEGRIFASGGLRFRLNAWFDLRQVGGGFESGLRNRLPVDLAYQVRTAKVLDPARAAHDTVLLLKALGVQYVAVHGPQSQEYYRDFQQTGRLAALPAPWREGDDAIYEVPASPMARLIASEELPGIDPHVHPERLERYVAAGDDAVRPRLRVERPEPGRLLIEGPIPADRMIEVAESWDPGWEAQQDGRAIHIDPDQLGFMVLKTTPAAHAKVELRYRGTGEQRVMAGISILAWLGMLGLLIRKGAAAGAASPKST
jgi:hypothetical protein